MNDIRVPAPAPRGRSTPLVVAAVVAIALALGACGTGTGAPTIPALPTIGVPTLPADGLGSGSSACLDAATMAIVEQLQAAGADVPNLLAQNKDALISGLEAMETTDASVQQWRDALVSAIDSEDAALVAAQIARLSSGEVTIAEC